MYVFEISIEDQLAEVERELRLREQVYPRWVKAPRPKLSQASADQQMARLRAVRASLEDLARCRPALELMAGAVMRDWSPPAGTATIHFADQEKVLAFLRAYDEACFPAKVPLSPSAPRVPQ